MAGPTNDEGPTVGAVGLLETKQADAPIVHDLDASRKAYTTLQAKAAVARCSLYELAGGGFLLCRGSLSRELPDLHAVSKLLRQIGGAV